MQIFQNFSIKNVGRMFGRLGRGILGRQGRHFHKRLNCLTFFFKLLPADNYSLGAIPVRQAEAPQLELKIKIFEDFIFVQYF